MANSACSVKTSAISSAFISKEGNEILSAIKAPRYVDYINYLFGKVFKREYLDNESYVTLSDFTDDNNKFTVGGNLNNLYTKVKEELVSQINSDFMLTLPNKDMVANELIAILENWKLFVDFHSKYNAYIAVRPEDLEEEEKETNNYDKSGNEHTEFSLLTNEVRTVFKFLPKTQLGRDSSGKIVGSPIVSPVDGLPLRSDFENVFKLTLDVLKGIKDEAKFIERLTSDEVMYRIPELYFLFEILPVSNETGTSNLTNKQRRLFHQFFQVMSRDYIPVYASTVTKEKDKLPSYIRYASAKSNVNKIEKQFISNFISNQEVTDYVIVDNTIDDKNPENSVFGRKRLVALPQKLPLIDLSSDDIKALSVRKIKSDYKAYFDFYKVLGIEFSDFSLLSDKRALIKVLNHALTIHDNLSERLKRNTKIFNPIKELKTIIRYADKENKPKVINQLRSVLKDIFKFEGGISKISPTLVTKAANGENQSDITYSNAISISAQQINSVSSLEELYEKPYFKKLKYNPLHKNSYIGTKVIGNNNVEYQIENYSGYTVVENEDSFSSDTKSLSDASKFESDFNNLMAWATINTPQLESKAGYFAIKFIDKNTGRTILPFSENLFAKDFITDSEFTAQIAHYLLGEIERVRSYSKVSKYAPTSYGEFHIFKNFITPEIKEDLLKDINSAEYKRAVGIVLSKMNKYFNDELSSVKNFIQKNNITNYISKQVLERFKISEEAFTKDKVEYEDTLLRTFIANDFVHNVEFGIYVSGDPLFYKDYHKRLGGLASTGTQPINTNNIKSLFASDQEKIFWDTFSLRGILNQVSSEAKQAERRDNSETFLSAVLKEDNVKENTEYQKQSTTDNYIYSVKLNTGKDITEEQAKKDLKIDQISKKGIDVGDGQGYLNLDAARELSIKQGTYRPQQDVSYKFEALIFKQLLLEEKDQTLDKAETKLLRKLEGQIFRDPDKYALPTLKQTYYGTISNESVEIDAKIFDKFSLAILLPSTARNHPKLKNLLLAMSKRQIHYVKYQSGTKGFIRDIFKNAEEISNENNELDELQTSLLKLQITPPKTEKNSTKISTQKLKLLFTNLFDKGKASESVIKLRNKFLNDLSAIKDFNRKNVLRKLGFTVSDIDGKIISWDKEKVINALVSQVNLQKLPTPLLEALETDENGDFLNTIESSNIYQQVLNYITGKLDSTLREFKVNGGDFVLLSESMFERPLNYFRLNEGKTETLGCDCRITMTKEYAKMLSLPDFEDKSKKIGSITRMNELLLIPEFREKYKKELTIAFSRPPVQGPNSMGFATITEFFYPTAGNILQLPKEFMHQAGIDFDYDKEKVLVPSLTNDGIYINKENLKKRKETLEQSETYKALYQEGQDAQKIYDYLDIELDDYESEEEFNKAKEAMLQEDNVLKFLLNLFPTNKEEIEKNLQDITKDIVEYINVKNAQKSILSNNLLESMKEALKQPEIYSELILPNTDSTVKPLALSNGKDISNLNTLPSGIDVYSYMQNLKVFKLFNDAKALLGPFALHNVFMELVAPLNIVVNLDYAHNKEGVPTKKVNLLLSKDDSRTRNISTRYDENGDIKQHITSEFINATVDSAKDPYFANFILSFDNINTFTFLMALNYPVETIVDFTSSAVVRKYLDLKNKNKDLPKEVIAKIILSEISPRPLKGAVGMDEIIKTDESFIGMDNTELLSKLKEFKSDESLENKDNFKYLAAILCNFIAMEEHSKQFSNFKNLFKNDTNKTSSLYEISSKKSLRNTVTSAGMFTSESVAKVEGNSTMTAFRNDDLIAEVLSNVFPIMSDPIVFKGLGNLFNESKAGLKPVDKRILSQIITNDYITSILYSYGEYNGENFFTYGRKLISKNKQEDGTLNTTLLERIYKLKQHKSYPELLRIFPVLEKILGEVSSKPLKGNLVYKDKFGFNVLLNIAPNLPILEKEDYMRQFKQIVEGDFELENQMVKTVLVSLTKDFFIAGLMQSGFNKSGISFIEYAPVKFVQSLLNPALDKYNLLVKNNPEGLEKYIARFKTIFTLNNSKYFFIQKDYRKFIVKHNHLGKYLYTAEAPTGTYTAPAKPALPLPSLPNIESTNAFTENIDTTPKTINIYSTDKNGFESLSNMAIRPFRYNFGASYTDFNSVEQAYQAAKYQYTDQSAANQKVEEAILNAKNSFEIKQLGRKFSKLDRKEWDKNSSRIMKDFIKESFKQNPEALAKLLSTGDVILTHTQDSTKWKTEFPKLLMEVRDELSGEPISENPVIETSVIEELQSSLEDNKKVFTYKGVTIDTEFVLGEQQKEALEALIDFANSDKTFMTLQGAAGTGKTTIIGYLQKYLKNKASFAYMAPTHAATAELAFATVKTGSNILPSTLQSAISLSSKTKRHVFTQKIQKRVGYNPIFILDESSMIDKTDIDKIQEALDDFGGKVIFLGDEKQISKVTQSNDKTKPVSPAFTSFDQVRLTKIYRQSDNSLLNLLSAMREQTDFKLFKVENSDIVKFVNKKEFNQELVKDLDRDPENTVVVTYTNNSVKGTNVSIRSVLGRTGQTVVNDIVVGYLGYASKQIEKGDIANSISYIITNIEKDGSKRVITARSSKLTRLIDSGIGGISDMASTVYYQLDVDDSLTFDDLTKLDYEQNNKAVAKVFKQLHEAGLAYSNKEINYKTYLMILAGINDTLRQYSVGNDYIYNPATDKMERYDAIKHKALKINGQGSLLFSKDIDYGHAITIHKSQGATIDNVYFDASSLNAARNVPIVDENNNQVTTEKMSLAYVAMSRSKKKLVVYEGDNTFELLKNEKNDVSLQNNKDLNDIGFKDGGCK